jgi:hypothetical protein
LGDSQAPNGPTGQTIPISRAVYDPTANTVTLFPTQLLNMHLAYTLTVVGTGPNGVRDTNGVLLDGARTGQPGSNFTGVIDSSVLVLPSGTSGTAIASLRRQAGLRAAAVQRMELHRAAMLQAQALRAQAMHAAALHAQALRAARRHR